MLNSWNGTIITAQSPGVALSGAGGSTNIGTTPTSLLPGQAHWPMDGSFLWFVGQRLRVKAAGLLTTPVSPSSVSLSLMFDSIAVFAGGAVTPTASQTNATWRFEVDLDVRAVGQATAAALLGIGSISGSLASVLPAANPANGNGFDSTLPHSVDLFATFGAATSGQTIQLLQYELLSVL